MHASRPGQNTRKQRRRKTMRWPAFAFHSSRTCQAVSGGQGCGVDDQGPSDVRTGAARGPASPWTATAGPFGSNGAAGLASLAAGLAHDIRNPLTTIKTFASVLRTRKDQPGFVERFERSVAEGVARIETLLDDLADLANTERPYGTAGESLEAVHLPDLLASCLDALDEELAVRGIAREQSAQEGLPLAQGHAARLRKAFMSLLRFSCQIVGSGGKIAVHVERGADGCLAAYLAGSGLDIAAEHLPRVFEPYFSTSKGRGAGLSLTLARKIVHEHGGDIAAFSRPGQGTAFCVLLPAWQ